MFTYTTWSKVESRHLPWTTLRSCPEAGAGRDNWIPFDNVYNHEFCAISWLIALNGATDLSQELSTKDIWKICGSNVQSPTSPQMKLMPQSTHFVRKLLLLSAEVTCSEFIVLYLDKSLAFSHSKNLTPSFVYGSRPKWQYAAVSWYLGSRSAKVTAIAPGRQSNSILMMLVISSAVRAPCSVPPC